MTEGRESTAPDGAERRTEEALFWFTRTQGARISEADRAALEAWRAADPRNETALRRVEAFWGSPEAMASVACLTAVFAALLTARLRIRRLSD